MAKIGLDYGHGTDTFPPSKGVYHNGKPYPEHNFNTTLGLKVKALLKKQGHKIIEGQQAQQKDVPLIQRTNLYNRKKVDLVWSIHANSNSSSGVQGRCAFYWHTASKSKRLAELYVDEVKKAGYSTHGDGLHAGEVGSWTNLHINRETDMVAVLTENGFMTGDEDFDLVFGDKQEEYTDAMAKVHVKAIQRFLDEDYKDADVEPDKPSKPPKPSKPSGGSIVDHMNAEGMDASYSNRAKLAKEYGIKGYKGTAKQNKKLLKLLRKGKPSKPTKKGDMKTGSIVTYLRSIDVNSSYSNRAKLASKHGIKGYKGSASQNTRLLEALRGDEPKNKPSKKLPNVVLREGARGENVRKVQEALAAVYYYPNKGAKNNGIDSIYGKNTADAVRRFQSTHGLKEDGIFGPDTRAKLI